MIKLHKIGTETLESYNELIKQMFTDDNIEVLDRAIVNQCGVKLRNVEKLAPTLRNICEAFHEDQVSLRM